jgi:hypothetical protein
LRGSCAQAEASSEKNRMASRGVILNIYLY